MAAADSFYLDKTPYRVRWLCDQRDAEVTNKLYVCGCYNSRAEVDVLCIGAITTTTEQESAPRTAHDPYMEVAHAGSVNDLQVVQTPAANIRLVLTASSTGKVSRCPLTFDPQTEHLTGINNGESQVEEWISLPRGAVASIDVWQDSQMALAVGDSGAMVVAPLEAEGARAEAWKAPIATTSYSQGRWTDSHTFVTAGTAGGLQCWDVRSEPRPTSRSPLAWGSAGVQGQQGEEVFWLAVHPSRPNLCATGGSSGSVVLWDLRFQQAPVVAASSGSSGAPIWEVAFDTADMLSSAHGSTSTPLLYCTEDGRLCRVTPSPPSSSHAPLKAAAPPAVVEVILDGCAAINSFHAEPAHGQDVLYVTDRGYLGCVGRGASGSSDLLTY